MSDPQARTKQIASIATAVAISITVYLIMRHRVPHPTPTPAPAPAARDAGAAAPSPDAAPAPAPARHVRRLADPAKRPAMLEAIRAQAERRFAEAQAAAAGAPPPTLPEGDLARDYIRTSVKEITPLLVECYEQALGRDAKLAGTITVDFTIEGEPGLGGVIGDSKVREDRSDLKDPELRQCIQETMYAIEIDPPANGGVVRVSYPFTFRPGDDAGSATR